jgi:hypothetical protein
MKTNPSTTLLERYNRSTIIRALIQLIPFSVGGAVDVFLMGRLETIRAERAKAFFDELSKSEAILTPDVVDSEDFLHRYFATVKCALNTRRREKIEAFARLLKTSLDRGHASSDADIYEDFLSILDDLSYREIRALALLEHYYQTPRTEDQNDLQWTSLFWEDFVAVAGKELSLQAEEFVDFMNRIARTGCYEMFTGSYMGYTGGKGRLTPTYFKLKRMLKEEGS